MGTFRVLSVIIWLVAAIGAQAPKPGPSSDGRVSGSLGIKYEKPFTVGKPWPVDLSRAKIEIDNRLVSSADRYFKDWRPSPEEVRRTLTRYRVISWKEWTHARSHVGGNDRGGWVTLDDGSRLKWMLRPGGLGVVVYPDGGAVYLDGCCLEK